MTVNETVYTASYIGNEAKTEERFYADQRKLTPAFY
jgi:hypothetical protein